MNIFITGVSSGFGKELALHYVNMGHNVFGISRNLPDSNTLKGKELTNSKNFFHFKGSVNNAEAIDRAIEEAVKSMGNIDVLINNAAFKVFKNPVEITEEEYRESVITNLLSPIIICKKLLPRFVNQKSGHIINISSNAGMTFYEEGSAYCSSKAGLIAYTLSIAEYLKDKNVTANVISPPTFTTEDYRINYPDVDHKKLLKSEQVMKIVDYIVLNKKFITGKNFPVFKFKTYVKFIIKKKIESIGYLFQFRLK
jgi:NAD(P)-dependent dehydrogenase (short-subunit alcohol dehydrogenase family)